MLKRICLLSLAGLLILSFAGAMTAGLSREAAAQTVRNRAALEDIEGLDSLKVSLGATQNSLTLELGGGAGTRSLAFRSSDGWTETIPGPGFKRVSKNHSFRYVAEFPSDLAYAPSPDSAGRTWPAFCDNQTEILVYGGEPYHDDVDGYNQDFRDNDLGGRNLRARIHLPLLADGGAVTDVDYCFFLEADVEVEDAAGTPMFALTGNSVDDGTCSGLQLYGRGGDDLETAGVNWFCDGDIDADNFRRTEIEALTSVESPPFGNYFIFLESRPDSDDCGGRILVNRDDLAAGAASPAAQWQDWHNDCRDGQFDKGKDRKRTGSVSVLNTLRRPAAEEGSAPGGSQTPGLTPADTGGAAPAAGVGIAGQSCEFQLSGIGIGYLACWAAEAISGGLNWLESAAKENLRLDGKDYTQTFPDEDGGQFTYKDAWANIRNFMTFAVVGTALFMVISTALDIGFFSNYTVKKYLPRLIIGTILIQFSWALGDLFIQLTNQLGDFMESILYAAVPGSREHGLAEIFGGGNFVSFFTGAAGIAASGAILTALLPVGFTAIAFLFVGWLFLVARKYMLIMLLILGPLGLALWVLPGSDRAWRFYSKTFFYLLLFYPIVVTTIAAGKIFSYLILL